MRDKKIDARDKEDFKNIWETLMTADPQTVTYLAGYAHGLTEGKTLASFGSFNEKEEK